ncbi:M23 family metallopeptidase [Salidesulfovibrio onnuriiensis]|uniref:M23 family metallopeptidase n=1 Tax=Salidesulfovibrio onnuriiensis TaxID=2583823 RepID=UPI0011C9FF68|nr:M23 family metallopeptidase [Salidesulfovibrio onnuriiensis]
MNKEKKKFPFGAVIAVLVLAVLAAGGFVVFRDTTPPTIAIEPDVTEVGQNTEYIVTVEDPGSGLKSITVDVIQGKTTLPVLSRDVAQGTTQIREKFTLPKGKLKDGSLTVRVSARDASFYPFGQAGKSLAAKDFTLDSKPPRIMVQTHTTNLTQGGAGLLIYALSEEAKESGIQVGERFFPAYKQAAFGDKNIYYCMFAMPWDTPPAKFSPMIVATDTAGNSAKRSFPYHANARNFRKDRINLSDSFFEKTLPEFQQYLSGEGSLLEQYLKINTEVRGMNRAELVKVGRDTADAMLWKGPFKRLPNSANRARFADARDYYYQGKVVDQQTHLGLDLASTQQAPVPAGNDGIVAYADFLGIYGNVVIIDHGLGLQTLYAHLTSMSVARNDNVTRGQIIGHTGTTGLAGGDHLHYGVIISGIPVQPFEWWDARWIKHNITSKLQ